MFNKINILQNEQLYLTENIVLINKKMYNVKKKKKLITKKNWPDYLSEYGWEILEYKLNYKYNKKNEYSLSFLECGGDGNCFFYCICQAINNPLNQYEEILSIEEVKNKIVNEITVDNYQIIIDTYKIQKKNNEFQDEWDPDSINTIDEVKNIFKNSGNKFWTDHITIQLLQKALNINIYIIYETDNYELKPYNLMNINDNYNKSLFILYTDQVHFQLIGCFYNSQMITLFENSKIPKILSDIIKN